MIMLQKTFEVTNLKKGKIISSVLATLGIAMISIALVIQSEETAELEKKKVLETKNTTIQLKNMATSANTIINEEQKEITEAEEEKNVEAKVIPIDMEIAPASVIIPPRIEVYEGMTIDELAAKLNRNLGNGYISGKGYLIASQCIEKGVDPYVAVAIMLHETGCKYNCSTLVRSCNNVGGQKGAPGCNGGSYKAYATLDDGIIGFINNLQRNYYAKGLNTIEKIAPRYAASSAWPTKIRSYVEQIRAN